MSLIANARMYAVTPAVEAVWRELIARVCDEAKVPLDYAPYPAPQPLEALWARPDLGAVQMCGYPIAMGLAPVTPIAAPVLALDWAGARAVYRSDFIVRVDSRFLALEDTFGGRIGWTVDHSQSGFNAPRHHLLRYRTPDRPRLYRESIGPLVTARKVLDGVIDGSIDVGPLDGYWHALMRRHAADLTARVRTIESTDPVPIPPFVAAAGVDAATVARLRDAFVAASSRPWFAALGAELLITGFVSVSRADYAVTLAWDRAARAAGYPAPA